MSLTFEGFFSIDLDQKINKVTRNRFVEEHFYVVELIKTALLRGAGKVEVTLGKGRLVVKDNGSGIPEDEVRSLRYLFDTGLPVEKREAVIEGFIRKTGIGLMALFTPRYRKVKITNLRESHEEELVFEGMACRFRGRPGRFHPQTEITLELIRDSKPKPVRDLIAKYCSHLKQSITINGNILPFRPLLRNAFVQRGVPQQTHGFSGQIGIPREDGFCRIQLLHAGIPWTARIMDPQEGLVFEAAVESEEECYQRIVDALSPLAYSLYEHMCGRYSEYPPDLRDRTEELVFNQVKKTGRIDLLKDFRIFPLTDGHTFSYQEIILLLQKEPVRYIYRDQKREGRKAEELVFSLSRRQADFLINHLNLGITPFEESQSYRPHRLGLLYDRIHRMFHFLLDRLVRLRVVRNLSAAELQFRSLVRERCLSQGPQDNSVSVELCSGRWGSPIIQKKGSRHKGKRIIFIKKDHTLIRNAVAAALRSADYVELLDPYIHPPRGTVRGE